MNTIVGIDLGTQSVKVIFYSVTEVDAQARCAGRGAGGVFTVPYFNGERTPNLPNGKASIFGLDALNCRSENLLRSAMESATYALRFGIDEMLNLGVEFDEIILTGGGSNGSVWRQIVCDVMNKPVTVVKQSEGSSFGAALHALAAGSAEHSLIDLAETHITSQSDDSCDPSEEAVGFYNESYLRYQEAAEAVRSLYG